MRQFVLALMGVALLPLNATIVPVILPIVSNEFQVSFGLVGNLATLYLGFLALALPACGVISDKLGHLNAFRIGLGLLLFSSIIALLSVNIWILLFARCLQGVSAAVISPSAIAIIRNRSKTNTQGQSFGSMELVLAGSAAIGPIVGGAAAEIGGWRGVFAVPAFLSIALLVVAGGGEKQGRVMTPSRATPGGGHRDVMREVLILSGIAAIFIFGVPILIGTISRPIIAIVVFVVAMVLTLKLPRLTRNSIGPLRFFARPGFFMGCLGVFSTTALLQTIYLIVPASKSSTAGEQFIRSGIMLFAMGAASALVAPLAGRVSDRIGRKSLVVAGAVLISGTTVLYTLTHPDLGSQWQLAALTAIGVGLGLSSAPRQAAAFAGVAPSEFGGAAGVYYTTRHMGGVFGAAMGAGLIGASPLEGGLVAAAMFGCVLSIIALMCAIRLPSDRPENNFANVLR